MLRAAGANIVTALSGSETVEQAYALGKLLRQGLGAHCAVMPEDVSPALDAFRLPLSAIRDAELIVILGDDPVVERAPIVDLWIKAARRAGAEVVESEIGEPGGGIVEVRDELGDRIRGTERTILIWSGPDGHGGATIAGARRRARPRRETGQRRVPPTRDRERPRSRRRLGSGCRRRGRGSGADRAPDRVRRRGRREPGRPRARRAGRAGARDLDVPNPGRRLGRPGPARHELPRARRDVHEPRGPAPAPAPRGHPAVPGRARLDRQAGRALRRRALAAPAAGLRGALRALLRRDRLPGDRRAAPRSPARADGADVPPAPKAPKREQRQGPAPRQLPPALLGPGGRADPRAPVPAPGLGDRALGRRREEDRRQRRLDRQRPLERNLRRASRAREQEARQGRRPDPRRARARSSGRTSRCPRERAVVDRPDQGGLDHQPAARHVRLPDLGRAQGPRAHAAPLRAEPRGPVRPPPADRRPREADPQGELLPGDRGRLPVHHGADRLRLHGARSPSQSSRGARAGTSPATTSRARSPTSRSR